MARKVKRPPCAPNTAQYCLVLPAAQSGVLVWTRVYCRTRSARTSAPSPPQAASASARPARARPRSTSKRRRSVDAQSRRYKSTAGAIGRHRLRLLIASRATRGCRRSKTSPQKKFRRLQATPGGPLDGHVDGHDAAVRYFSPREGAVRPSARNRQRINLECELKMSRGVAPHAAARARGRLFF